MKSLWRLIPHETEEGSYNLEFDAQLLKEKLPYPILRFYSWKEPCLSYGYFQKKPSLLGNLPAYRRVTGGGIVFHDKDLTYSLTYPRGSVLPWSVKRSYVEIHRIVQRSLHFLGIETIQCVEEKRGDLCFESPVVGDLLYRGKKVAGAAQRRVRSHLLHQGTLLVEELHLDRLQLIDAMIKAFEQTYHVSFEKVGNALSMAPSRRIIFE
ncbi:MAG: hypothetical protein HY590_07640 [Candidatus Omnitrophica bacterium]|nr:hypothetical protein [Candidatus Omnitrophota bacterium]